MQLRRPLACPPRQACNGWNRIHALLEHHGVVPVGTADEDHQRDASGIYDDMSFGAELASVGGVGARFLAPRGLGTEEPSMLARLQSIWSCSRRRTCMAWCKRYQTRPNAAKRHWHSSHASAASRSYHCRNPRTEASLPWDACLLHEQNAIECCFIAHGELACVTFDGRREGGDQGLQLSPQYFANGLSCHEGQKHKCFWLISKGSDVSGS